MGNVWIKEFTGGLDTRRLPETTVGGVLVKARNVHLTRGGDIQKRASFVPIYQLPAGTIGMATGKTSLYVFGSDAAPSMPSGVTYQRLQHPDGGVDLTRVLSTDMYAGKMYAVGEFADGSIHHFYDGAVVTDWFDGRARAAFEVTGGLISSATSASGSFEITGGTAGGSNQITDISIDGVSIINTPVSHTGNNSTTAAAVAAAINAYTSGPDYTATAIGQLVVVTAAATGTAVNGKVILTSTSGTMAVSNATVMSGGAISVPSQLVSVQVNGTAIISAPVDWTTDAVAMAADIASAITSDTSTPEYTATSDGAIVNIVASTPGAAQNGLAVTFTTADGLTVSPATGLVLSGGQDSDETFQPGSFVKTIGSKAYSTSGANMHFSGISQPTKWTTDTTGAGFIDLSTEASGSEELIALGKYQDKVAAFAERIIQIWYVDPDPTLNRQYQVLNNTGTLSPKSVTQFGDADLFYLDESGLRSMRARDASIAAASYDIGVAVDTMIVEKLRGLTVEERQSIVGLIEPRDGRFWLAVKDVIFVFSYYPGSRISAWSTYEPSIVVDGVETLIDMDDLCVFRRRVYMRSGDTIYVYGGSGTEVVYDAITAEAWLPYLDANDPSREKNWTSFDCAVRGQWAVSFAMLPTNQDAEDEIGVFDETTFSNLSNPALGQSTHLSLRFRSVGDGAALLSSVVVQYDPDADEDK